MSIAEKQPPAAGLDPDPLAGTKYRGLERIGQGGMGEVVLVEHIELGRNVVVKLLHTTCQGDSEMVDRMRIEAQTLARLCHPNIVAVNDVGRTPGGRPFVVMERLRGRTLHAELHERGALPPAEALAIIQSVLGALAAAHELGVVHRDVKPANIFLHQPRSPASGGADDERVVKLLDFGLAKVLSGASPRAPAPLAEPTQDGAVLGTPGYLSPEQAAGRPLDARSDLYAAGLVLYRMVAGRRPFEGTGEELIAATLKKRPAPPSHFSAEPIPPELDHAVLKALAKDPDRRFQTAREFATALGLILSSWSLPVGWVPTLAFDGSSFAGPIPDYIRERLPFAALDPGADAAPIEAADSTAAPAPSRVDQDEAPPVVTSRSSSSSTRPGSPALVFAIAVIVTAALVAALVAWLVSGA
jgi:serine/threonine-protein kinase